MEDLLLEIRKKLLTYIRSEILFNEPHFTQQLLLRDGNREMVISLLLNPELLAHVQVMPGLYGDKKYSLYFQISSERTIKLPVIFNKGSQKNLYVLTYILRYRSWQRMVK